MSLTNKLTKVIGAALYCPLLLFDWLFLFIYFSPVMSQCLEEVLWDSV